MNRLPVIVRQYVASFRILVVFTVICGVLYPALELGISQLAFHKQANGSLVSYNGRVVGSGLLCQEFVNAKGQPLPQWFQPRPSAATSDDDFQPDGQLGGDGDYGCDAEYSSATNLGPDNPLEVQMIASRQKQISAFDHVPISEIPPDAVTASGSGLDPDISPQNADIQAARVATERHLPLSTIMSLIAKNTMGRDLGVMGEPAVNVLTLNIAIASLPGQGQYNAYPNASTK
jgi:potassium-transporting ATPase KdpC subunit